MAKKRKKDKVEKEEYEFRPPEFDEKEFLKKELRDTKTVLFTIGYAAIYGILAGLMVHLGTEFIALGAALLVVGVLSLKFIYPLVKVDLKEFTKKNWAGNLTWFFLSFLAAWILMFNYPFADFAEPQVTEITVWVTNDAGNVTAIDYKDVPEQGGFVWVPRWGDLNTLIRSDAAYTVNITARVADNGELANVMIAIGSPTATYEVMGTEGENRYGYTLTDEQLTGLETSLLFYIRAGDDAGNVELFYPRTSLPVSG